MTLKVSTAIGTVWAVARLPERQLGFLVSGETARSQGLKVARLLKVITPNIGEK